MYHSIIENQVELIYNDIHPFKGAVEELGQKEIDEITAGFSSREIIVRLLYMPKDEEKNIIEIENNNFITYASKKYIVSSISKEKGMDGYYYNLHAFEEIKQPEDVPEELNSIGSKLEKMIEGLFGNYIDYSMIPKWRIKTQETYDALPYPRVIYDFDFRGNVKPSFRRSPVLDISTNKYYEIDFYNRECEFNFEFYSTIKSKASLWKFDEFLLNRREIGIKLREYFLGDDEIIAVNPVGDIDQFGDNSTIENNQGRTRKTVSFILGVTYIRKKQITDFIEEVKVKGGDIIAENIESAN